MFSRLSLTLVVAGSALGLIACTNEPADDAGGNADGVTTSTNGTGSSTGTDASGSGSGAMPTGSSTSTGSTPSEGTGSATNSGGGSSGAGGTPGSMGAGGAPGAGGASAGAGAGGASAGAGGAPGAGGASAGAGGALGAGGASAGAGGALGAGGASAGAGGASAGAGGADTGAGGAGEGAGGSSSTPGEEDLDMTAEDFACIGDWEQVLGFRITNLLGHTEEALAVARSESGGEFPVGTILQHLPTEAMVKRRAGFSPESQDWEFFLLELSPDGVTTIAERGTTEIQTSMGQTCVSCHSQAPEAFDFVCNTWAEYGGSGNCGFDFMQSFLDMQLAGDTRCQ